MTPTRRITLAVAGVVLTGAVAFVSYQAGSRHPRAAPPAAAASSASAPPPAAPGKPLYWYDPMVPDQHFDHPGKSPFMDMPLLAKMPQAGTAAGPPTAGVRIDPDVAQDLGLRTAVVERGALADDLVATGVVDFDGRDLAIVQPRTAGFVQRVYGRAPGDVVAAGAPIADLFAPEWAGAQAEFLAVERTGDAALTAAARQRLRLLGMSDGVIASVERSGRPHPTVTITTPTGGVIQKLDVRAGMTVAAGQSLAEVAGLSTVWIDAAVPEAQAARVRTGQPARVTFAAFPGETFAGQVSAVLPQVTGESRTLQARIALANRGGRLRPGLFAEIAFGGDGGVALLVPSEALIRTGHRTLVMLATGSGRYAPVEVRPGRESGDRTQILAGLSEGDRVVASGQFLLDSEASLAGLNARPLPGGVGR